MASVSDTYAAFCAEDTGGARDRLRAALRDQICALESGGGERTQALLAVLALLEDPTLEDVHLLTGQMFVLLSGAAIATASTLAAWPGLGVLRASVIACRTRPIDHLGAEGAITDLYIRCRSDFDGSAYLCSILVDTLEALYAGGRTAAPAMYNTVLAPLVAMRSDLVTHRLARLASTLASGDARGAVSFLGVHAGPETRLLYLAAQQMLQAPALSGAAAALREACSPNLSSHALMRRIVGDSALAPSASDCLVALLAGGHEDPVPLAAALVAAERPSEGTDNVARFLLPRMAKRAPAVARAVMAVLAAGGILPRTGAVAAYAAIGAALLWGGSVATTALAGTLDLSLVEEALHAPELATRLAALQMLCRAGGGQAAPFDSKRAGAARRFLFHSFLATGAAARQQTAAALAAMFACHISRIYLLARSQTGDVEANEICAFWAATVRLATAALPTDRYDMRLYHRADAALRLLLVLARTLLIEWTPQAYPQNRGGISARLATVFAGLGNVSSVILNNVSSNPYDAAQEMAAELYSSALKVSERLGVLIGAESIGNALVESALDALHTSRRPFELEGAARILVLAADAGRIGHQLCERLVADADALDGPVSFEASGAVGTLLGLSALLRAQRRSLGGQERSGIAGHCVLDVENLRVVALACLRICRIVVSHLTHPTPEACTSLVQGCDEDDAVSDEDDNQDDAYTAMAFCWRAAKHSTILLVDAMSSISKSTNSGASCASTPPSESHYTIGETFAVTENRHTVPLGEELHPPLVAREMAEMLMDVRHPGVFTALAEPLARVVRMCCVEECAKLLDVVLLRCIDHDALRTTRRSGGLPLCVSAVVSSAANPSSALPNPLLVRAVEHVTVAAASCDAPASARVHALNILRHLARDAVLADAFRRHHLPASFDAALAAFYDADWAVRNSGMLLFAALMTRTFGVCHDADPLALKVDHCDAAAASSIIMHADDLRIMPRDAFATTNVADVRAIKCDALLAVVERRMRDAAASESVAKWSSDYVVSFAVCPLVAFALRVRFPPGALDGVQLNLRAATVDLLLAVLGSRILKARLMAARVLQRIQADGVDLASRVIATVSEPSVSSNTVHGALLFAQGNAEVLRIISEKAIVRISACRYLTDLAVCPTIAGGDEPCKATRDKVFCLTDAMQSASISHCGNVVIGDPERGEPINAAPMGHGAEYGLPTAFPAPLAGGSILRETLQKLTSRIMPLDELEQAIVSVAPLGEEAQAVFESFWTGVYDIAGTYRHALASVWSPCLSKAMPRWRRLHYLALTDDDSSVRAMAADGRFDGAEATSPAAALENALRAPSALAELGELVEWMPAAETRVHSGRERLFDTEPLNSYKDLWWQRFVTAGMH